MTHNTSLHAGAALLQIIAHMWTCKQGTVLVWGKERMNMKYVQWSVSVQWRECSRVQQTASQKPPPATSGIRSNLISSSLLTIYHWHFSDVVPQITLYRAVCSLMQDKILIDLDAIHLAGIIWKCPLKVNLKMLLSFYIIASTKEVIDCFRKFVWTRTYPKD